MGILLSAVASHLVVTNGRNFFPTIYSFPLLQVWILVYFQWKFIWHMAAFLKHSNFPQVSPLSLDLRTACPDH